MKNLIIAAVCLLLLIVPWCIYDKYAGSTISKCTDILDSVILPAVQNEDWETAEKSYKEIMKYWNRFEKISEFFLDAASVNEADELVNKTKYHIKLRDASNAAADSSELIHLLSYLHENEMISYGNIF